MSANAIAVHGICQYVLHSNAFIIAETKTGHKLCSSQRVLLQCIQRKRNKNLHDCLGLLKSPVILQMVCLACMHNRSMVQGRPTDVMSSELVKVYMCIVQVSVSACQAICRFSPKNHCRQGQCCQTHTC